MTYAEMVAGSGRHYSADEYTPYLPNMDASSIEWEKQGGPLIDGWASYKVHFTAGPLPPGNAAMRLRQIDAESSVA